MKIDKYQNLDGIRAYATICIILMHVNANMGLNLNSFLFVSIIPSFTFLVFLFMLISSFSLCCGYYSDVKNGFFSIEQFYKKRYLRIWPFFALLCTAELIINRNLYSLYEWFANLTLCFGLLPNPNIEVVGVGWFLGVIFVFYMIFPFFVFLISNKYRAWMSFVISIIMNILCTTYFFDRAHVIEGFVDRRNIVYCFMFFLAGGIIYLYRKNIINFNKVCKAIIYLSLFISVFIYFFVIKSVFVLLVIYSSIVICAIFMDNLIIKKIFQNKFILFINSISLEMYLCHMFTYRFLERFVIHRIDGLPFEMLYLTTAILTVIGSILIAHVYKIGIGKIQEFILKERKV